MAFTFPTDTNNKAGAVKAFGNDFAVPGVDYASEVTVLASTARTASGESAVIDAGSFKEAVAFLDVTAASGTTPTLTVKFQTQDPVSLKWFDLAGLTFTQATAATTEMKALANLLGSKIKCVYNIGGTTPSFTFSVGLVLKS